MQWIDEIQFCITGLTFSLNPNSKFSQNQFTFGYETQRQTDRESLTLFICLMHAVGRTRNNLNQMYFKGTTLPVEVLFYGFLGWKMSSIYCYWKK
jgi:hypothetical protein